MKKLFTFCTAMLLAAMATAQTDETFQFVDADGNEVADGTTITVSQLNEEGQMVVPLYVRNASGEKAAVSLYETIDDLPNGTWQTCAFGNCMQLTKSGYSAKIIANDEYSGSIETEWMPQTGSYATWEATLQIHVFNIVTRSMFGTVTQVAGNEVIGYGPTVTVRFEYKDTPHTGTKGDVNGDGAVDVADISSVITIMASATTPEASAEGPADVNGDGTVDVADISSIITLMAEK